MQYRINKYRMAWLAIAGTILAAFALSAYAQYPGPPGDTGTGVMPMAPPAVPALPQNQDSYGVVPKAPYAPAITTRPAAWVGGTAAAESSGQYPQTNASPQTNPPPQSPLQWSAPAGPQSRPSNYPATGAPSFVPPANSTGGILGEIMPNPVANEAWNLTGAPQLNPSTIALARVGSEGIFASEIAPQVDRFLAEYKAKMSPEEFELQRAQFEMQRNLMIQKSLKSHIESKLILQDVKRDLPVEAMTGVNKQLTGLFEKTEMPKLLKRESAANAKELERKLNAFGNSIAQEKKAFIEKALVGEWVRRQIKPEELPTVIQLTNYYETHKADFTTPAKARWEELTVGKAKYPSKEEALAALARMGNRVLVGGEPFAEVAKQSSDGFTAAKGGYRDWASLGSLADKEIEKAVFGPSLPVGQLSQIIETPQDYNIVRVIERVDRKTADFCEVQEIIRKKIIEERNERQFRDYLERLEKRTPIWTIYDNFGDNLPLAERLTEKRR
ncbi:MAG: peptidyl-prolyl cis-trans isomerase [Pirellulales bacterium]|nr:peptidyl-prolyl cis-trans isomerase [Pirellulales bacterium]